MARRPQRPSLGALFTALTLGFVAVAVAAVRGGSWPVAVAAAALAVWMASLALGALRAR